MKYSKYYLQNTENAKREKIPNTENIQNRKPKNLNRKIIMKQNRNTKHINTKSFLQTVT